MSDRKRGIKLHPLNDKGREVQKKYAPFDHYAVGINENTGEIFLVHSDGVSYRVHHNRPFRFNDNNASAQFYNMWQILDMVDFDAESEVDLADWIREFGARLESNFYLASVVLTEETSSEKNESSPSNAYINKQILEMRHTVNQAKENTDASC